MIAIVGTINRRGVAFAADSAATHMVSSKHKIVAHQRHDHGGGRHHRHIPPKMGNRVAVQAVETKFPA